MTPTSVRSTPARPASRAPARRTAVAAGALVASTAVTVLSVGAPWAERRALLGLAAVQWALFATGAAAVRGLPVRRAVPMVLVGAAVLQAAAMTAPPRRSDDYLRYAWDGRVQAAGVDPYRYPPTDDALARLRDPWLFPGAAECARRGLPPDCPALNRPGERTIYPPVAEAEFLAVHALSPPGTRHRPWQLAAAALALLTAAALVRALRRTRGDPRLAVLWAWCPTVVLEAGNGAHVDVLAALLVVAGLWAAATRRPGIGGALLGAAVAVKLYPLLLVPAVVRRRPGRVLGAAAGVVALAYLPHVLAVGPAVLGYLPGYLREEGYDGARYGLLTLVLPGAAARAVAVAVLAVAAARALARSDPDRPWRAALPLVGAAFLVAAPLQGWYAVLLVALVALDGRWEWLAVAAASFPPYAVDAADRSIAQRLGYGGALLVVLAVVLGRAALNRRNRDVLAHPAAARARSGTARFRR